MPIIKKGTATHSILHMKCPRCREGDLFPTQTFSYSQSFDMHKRCPECGQSYSPEPGFYYGAMFVSYILTSFLSLALLGILLLGFGMGIGGAFAVLLLILAILFVWFFRIARSIWINLRVPYSPKTAARVREGKDKAASAE